MIVQIMQSIALQLKKHFTGKVYIDKVEQGFKNGDFFIFLINSERKRIRGKWWRNIYDLDIHVFESSAFLLHEKVEKIKALLEWIEFIKDDKPLHGVQISSSYINGIAHIFVTYTLDSIAKEENVKMQLLKCKGGLKNGEEKENIYKESNNRK